MTSYLNDNYRPRASRWRRRMRFAVYGLLGVMVVCVGVLLLGRPLAGPQRRCCIPHDGYGDTGTAPSPAMQLTGEPSPTASPLPPPPPVGPTVELQALRSQLHDATATLTALLAATTQARAQLNARARERKAVPATSRPAPARGLPPPAEPVSPGVQQAFVICH